MNIGGLSAFFDTSIQQYFLVKQLEIGGQR